MYYCKFFKDLFLFHVRWYFACMYLCVRVPDTLELELQVWAPMWYWEWNPSPLGRVANALKHWAISPAPTASNWKELTEGVHFLPGVWTMWGVGASVPHSKRALGQSASQASSPPARKKRAWKGSSGKLCFFTLLFQGAEGYSTQVTLHRQIICHCRPARSMLQGHFH